jgi:phytoene dehydrogenase-like protein
MSKFEVIVVGAGQNSLSAAAYLAAAGMKVLVLDKNPIIGGGTVSRAVTRPGFVHDTHAGQMVLIMANPLIAADELGLMSQFGLKFAYPDCAHATVFSDDNSYICTYYDVERTCQSIARFSTRDAQAHHALVKRMQGLGDLLISGMFRPPLPFGQLFAMMDQSLEGQGLVGAMLESAYDVICRIYENEKVRIHFLKWASESMIGPEEKGTGIIPLLLAGIQHKYKGGCVVGGTQKLADSLAGCIRHHGGELRADTLVTRIETGGGRVKAVITQSGERIEASKAIVANTHPWNLGELVQGLDPGVADRARQVRLSAFGAINSHWALREAPHYKAGPEVDAAAVVEPAPGNMQTFREHFDQLRYGRIPDSINASVQHHSNYDRTRVPGGQGATLYLYHFVPFELAGHSLEHWEVVKEEVKNDIMRRYQGVTTNMTADNIIAGMIETPYDMHRWSPSFQKGDLFGIGSYVDQSMGRRPNAELAQYKVPGIDGLYLSGPFMHPGGAVTGGGRATAIRMLDDLKVNYSKLIQT